MEKTSWCHSVHSALEVVVYCSPQLNVEEGGVGFTCLVGNGPLVLSMAVLCGYVKVVGSFENQS